MSEYNDKLKFYDNLVQVYKIVLITLSFILICFAVHKVYEVGDRVDANVQLSNQLLVANQKSAIEARKANKQWIDVVVNHIDCVVLLSKKYPTVNFPALNYDQLKGYLNECVVTE
jgi:hypothetical protein